MISLAQIFKDEFRTAYLKLSQIQIRCRNLTMKIPIVFLCFLFSSIGSAKETRTVTENDNLSTNAAVKVVFTERGLNYAATSFAGFLEKKLLESRTNKSGSLDASIGKFDYELKNIKITSFKKLETSVSLHKGHGITLWMKGGGLTATGQWDIRFKKYFIKFQNGGSFTASVDGVSIDLSVALGKTDSGSLSIKSTGCQCNIENFSITLKGGSSWIYNSLISNYQGHVKSYLGKAVCKELQNVIDKSGTKKLAMVNMQAKINNALTFNYGLASAPIFNDDNIESNHVGRFLDDDVLENAPEMQSVKDRMVSVSISEVSLNSGLRVLFKNNKLHHVQDLADPTIIELVQSIIEEANVPLQGSGLRASIGASSAPFVSIQPDGIFINVEAELKVGTVNYDGLESNASNMKIAFDLEVGVTIRDNKIIGSIKNLEPTVISSSLPDSVVKKIIMEMTAYSHLVLPYIRELLEVGLPLPAGRNIDFKDSVVHFRESHLIVASNVEYRA